MTKAEDGPAEKVWSSLSFEGMTKKNIETPRQNIENQWSLEEEFQCDDKKVWFQPLEEQTKEPAQLASPDADKSQPLTEAGGELAVDVDFDAKWVTDFDQKQLQQLALWSSSSHVFCLMLLMV